MITAVHRRFFLFVLSFSITISSFAQIDTAAITQQLDRNKDLSKKYAFALYKDGKLVYKRENGEYTLKTQQYIDASSQWLTSALAMILVQEGKVNLDDKVSTYLPIFAKYGKAYITLRHCLTHYTGIDAPKAFEKTKFVSLAEEVDHIASSREIKTNPGTEFFYSNVGFKIAARVLEIVGKKPFDRLIKDKLFSPMAMRNTSFTNDIADRAPDPSSGGISSASDYLTFLSMLLNKGTANGKQILTEESVKMLLTMQAKETQEKNVPKYIGKADYALGSWIIDKNDKDEPTAYTVSSYNMIPVLDVCRGYAFVLLAKEGTEIKREFYQQIKSVIDEGVACKQ